MRWQSDTPPFSLLARPNVLDVCVLQIKTASGFSLHFDLTSSGLTFTWKIWPSCDKWQHLRVFCPIGQISLGPRGSRRRFLRLLCLCFCLCWGRSGRVLRLAVPWRMKYGWGGLGGWVGWELKGQTWQRLKFGYWKSKPHGAMCRAAGLRRHSQTLARAHFTLCPNCFILSQGCVCSALGEGCPGACSNRGITAPFIRRFPSGTLQTWWYYQDSYSIQLKNCYIFFLLLWKFSINRGPLFYWNLKETATSMLLYTTLWEV